MVLVEKFIKKFILPLRRFASAAWFPPILGVLAAADAFVMIVPTDGLLISFSMAKPSRWLSFGVWTAIGSTIGAGALAYLASHFGLPWVEAEFPKLVNSESWTRVHDLMEHYGAVFVLGYSATPLAQQPAALIAGLAEMGIGTIMFSMLIGRLIKFAVIAYIGTHAPGLMTKLWGMQHELHEVGIDPDKKRQSKVDS
jgi:membrane protein YqaA with SNARE-associated domain